MSTPRVSVIMPVFNAAPFVSAAIESVLAQTFLDFELIVIDDASTDDSMQVVRGIQDERIRILENPQNLGAAKTKNAGIKEARGEFIAFLDADDIALPQRFEAQFDFLQGHPEVAVLGAQISPIDDNGASSGADTAFPDQPGEIACAFLFINCIAQSSVMLRRAALPPEPFRTGFEPAEDYDLWMRLAPAVHFANLKEALVKYRIHPGGVSARRTEAMRASLRSIYIAQLEETGVKPTPPQLELHRRIARWPLNPTRELVGRAEEWLRVLQKANAASHRHPQAAFDRMIAYCWHSLCLDSWQLGWWVWKAWWRSPLRRLAAATPVQYYRLLRRVVPVSLKNRSSLR